MIGGLEDTIVALASPPGGAARGIIRASGPRVLECLARVFQPIPSADLSAIRVPTAWPGEFLLPGFASTLPGEVLLWPGQRSYTRQPLVELHTLGSPPLLEALLEAMCQAGARLAQPGEFTLRAFLSGRIDLTQAEAVLGVVDAADPSQLDAALAQLAGGLARPLQRLRDELLDLLAHLEAAFDFAEEDLAFLTAEELDARLEQALAAVKKIRAQLQARAQAGHKPRAVLVGRPNVGKSSLFNALVGMTQALVSPQPGTTRDYLTAEMDLDGLRCELVDTAGLAPWTRAARPEDDIEAAAQAATRSQAQQAYVQLFCLDGTTELDAWEQAQLHASCPQRLVVITKVDAPRRLVLDVPAIETSAHACIGLAELKAALRAKLVEMTTPDGLYPAVASTAARSGESLRQAAEALARAQELHRRRAGEELVAAEVRLALEALGEVAGAVYTDDILHRVFSRFCVGK